MLGRFNDYAALVLVMGAAVRISSISTAAEVASAATETPFADRYRQVAERITTTAMAGNDAYHKLEQLCDDIGHRLSGSPQLDQAVRWAAEAMRKDGAENVRLEPVVVPHWVRGNESLTMIAPRAQPMSMLGLGGSIGTPAEGITAEVVAVADEAGLDALADGARGKIVLFNNPMPEYHPEHGTGYGTAVRFRSKGADLAAQNGAVACLVRSVTAKSLCSPHTGAMRYGEEGQRIPAAAITIEDAEMIARLQARGIPVKATLKMEARTLPDAQSANVIGELRGSALPDEVVVIGGHIDSWDVGQGAQDDGGGCITAMEAINVLRKLELRPRRTIRVVLWTNEENGLRGAKTYAEVHASELPNHVAAIESDGGSFMPVGYALECSDKTREATAEKQLRDILSLFSSWGATRVRLGGTGADISPMEPAGVMLMHHDTDPARYFDYHHSPADTLDKVDPQELSKNVAVMATVAYILADMPERLGASDVRQTE